MSSSTVPRTSPESIETVESTPPLEGRRGQRRYKTRRRRRLRAPRLQKVGQFLLWLALVVTTAIAFLILWQETAYAAPQSVGEPAVEPQRSASTSSDKIRPDTVEGWIQQIKSKGSEKSPPSPPVSGEAVEARSTPQPSSTRALEPAAKNTPEMKPRDSTPSPSPMDPSAKDTTPPGPQGGMQNDGPSLATGADAEAVADQLGLSKPLSEIPDRELLWHSSLDLILALEHDFAFVDPPLDPQVLETDLKRLLLKLSVEVDVTDNPQKNLESLRVYLKDFLGYAAVERETPDVELLLPRFLMSEKRASPLCVAMLTLALADNLNKYLRLEPVVTAGLLGLRYRSGYHRYILVPSYLDRLYSDEDFVRAAYGGESPPEAEITVLTRKQFWAMVVGAAGASLGQTKEKARAEQLLRRSIDLHPDQAPPRIALADVLRHHRQYAAAREELDRALELDPDHALARLARTEVLTELGLLAEVEQDLEWLFHRRSHEKAGVRLIRHYLERKQFTAAQEEWNRLTALPASSLSRAEREALRLEVEASPWVERLLRSQDDQDRFRAIDQLAAYPIVLVEDALLTTMQDSNLRLATYAWNQLRHVTKMDLPRDVQRWRDAFARRRR